MVRTYHQPTPAQAQLHNILHEMTDAQLVDTIIHYMCENATPADYEFLAYCVKCNIPSPADHGHENTALWWFNEEVRIRLNDEVNITD